MHVKADRKKIKNRASKIKTFDDALKSIEETEQPLKNELLKAKLTLAGLLRARKYYVIGSTILGIATYFYRLYRRRKHAEAL